MKLFLIAFFALVSLTWASPQWNAFKETHKKSYKNIKEENYRKSIFLNNLKKIEEHNELYENGLVGFSLKINHLADRTRREIDNTKSQRYAPKKQSSKVENKKRRIFENVPDSIDWRDYGVITPIEDQLYCESCWAFAVTHTVEAHMGIYRNTTVKLSKQNLEDCVYEGFTCTQDMRITVLEESYQYIVDNNGIDTENSYPYSLTSEVGPCSYNPAYRGATISGYANTTAGDEEELKAIVGTIGPVTVAVTTSFYWDFYREGIYYKEDCMNVTLPYNHAVVVVGYGTEDDQDYWLVKNSWGTLFGLEGYVKMARNRDNNCGLATYGRYPIMS